MFVFSSSQIGAMSMNKVFGPKGNGEQDEEDQNLFDLFDQLEDEDVPAEVQERIEKEVKEALEEQKKDNGK